MGAHQVVEHRKSRALTAHIRWPVALGVAFVGVDIGLVNGNHIAHMGTKLCHDLFYKAHKIRHIGALFEPAHLVEPHRQRKVKQRDDWLNPPLFERLDILLVVM